MALPTVRLDHLYTFTLPHKEALLVLKALGGRLKPEEVALARELGDRLTRARAAELEHTANQLREAMEGA